MQQRATSWNSLKYAIYSLFPLLEKLSVYFLKQRLLFKIIGCFLLAHLGVLTLQANNDASLDKITAACNVTDYNIVANKQSITMSTTMGIGGGNFANFVDGTGGGQSGIWWQRNANVVNQEILKMVFPSPAVLIGFETTGSNFLDNGVTYQIEGSNDGTNWTDLTGSQTFSSSKTAAAYGAGETSYKFPVTANTTPYTQYRMLGLTGQTDWNWVSEIYIATSAANLANLSNVVCDANGTNFDPADDFLTFDIDPCGAANGATYTVSVSAGTISPTSGTFGSSSTFTLQDGSAGGGDVTLTISGFDDGMNVTQVITDPGDCGPEVCGGLDWNLPANKVNIISTATVTVDKGIANLADGDLSTEISYKNATVVNKEIARFQFPEPAILMGIEFEAIAIFLNSGVQIRAEGSNDAVSWTDLSGTITTNGTLTAGQYGSTALVQDFPFPSNTTAYTYYRLYGIAGSSIFSREIKDAFFKINIKNTGIDNLTCNTNGTLFSAGDDYITFDLNPSPGTGMYSIVPSSGTITPSTATFGSVTNFRLQDGSAGAGDVTLTMYDLTEVCEFKQIIEDPGNCLPKDCGGIEWNLPANKSMITITQSTNSTDNPNEMMDSNPSTTFFFVNNTIVNLDLPKFQFPSPTKLYGFEFETSQTIFDANSTMVVQASNDNVNWTDLTSIINSNSLSHATGQYGTTNSVYDFAFPSNTEEYIYYRLRGLTGGTHYNHVVSEIYFSYDVFANNITNIGCDDSGTPTNFTDDKLTFDLNPSPGTGTYSIDISGGFTISPTTATFGTTTSFTVSAGSSGAGDLTLTVIDASVPCVQEKIIPNTKNFCLDTDLDGVQDITDKDDDNDGILDSMETAYCNIDYAILANRQMIEISATANTSGNIAVLLDGNNNNNNFYYPDVPIAGKEVVRVKFPKPTVLTGIEYEIGNSYMFNAGATTIMQASNDGTTWTDVSGQYVKAANTNAPGTITSAPYTETFLWSNSTPYLYYRLYGVSGNTNQNPWINELHFQKSYHCDFDEDGIEDHLDLDSDNDGIPDNVEAQATNTFTVPAADSPAMYTTNRGVNSAYLGGLTPENTDGDACADYMDTDSDNDNKSDKSESGLVFNNVIGANGLDSGSETADDYSAPNGIITAPSTDLEKSIPASIEVDYRRMALDFTASAVPVTCNGPIANSDAKLTVNSPTGPVYKVGFSEGTVYTGPDYNTATPGGALPFDVTTGLPNPTYPVFYTVRVYTSAIVFDDYVVELQPVVCARAELAVTMTPVNGNSAYAGETVEYLVTVTNAGPDPGVDVKVKVDIPTNTDFVSAKSSSGDYSSGSETWTLDLMPVGSQTLTITYRLK